MFEAEFVKDSTIAYFILLITAKLAMLHKNVFVGLTGHNFFQS